VVLLEGLTNHDNVGGVFRNAAAFGVDAVLYDDATCDPLYRKAIRVSVGGSLLVPFARAPQSADTLAALRAHGFSLIALSPRRDALDVTELGRGSPLPQRVALLFGSEGPGLREDTMRAADQVVRIHIAEHFDSLNVATTSGIVLHAVSSARRAR
jgi:tRNA G18 (ribose-2'-O)-methylase SpoU